MMKMHFGLWIMEWVAVYRTCSAIQDKELNFVLNKKFLVHHIPETGF
jgi:hypothetical protein